MTNVFPVVCVWSVVLLEPFLINPRFSSWLTLFKQEHPNAKLVFIGPCASKKLEASRTDVRSDVDFVITFEELVGMFEAKEIDIESFEGDSSFHDATGAGRGYAVSGGVASDVEACLKEYKLD